MPQIDLISIRYGWASDWTATNPILMAGEPGYEMDTGKMKVGNGTTPWVDLLYTAGGSGGGGGGTDEVWIGPTEPTDPAVELWFDTDATSTGGGGGTAQTIETVAGTTYTVVAADANKIKRLAATATVTLPSAGPGVGERVDFVCVGGPATFVRGPGATWDVAPTPSAAARAIGSFVTAIKMTATAWALTGDLA